MLPFLYYKLWKCFAVALNVAYISWNCRQATAGILYTYCL